MVIPPIARLSELVRAAPDVKTSVGKFRSTAVWERVFETDPVSYTLL